MLSIIVATYNRPIALAQCLASLLPQRAGNDVIIVDQSEQSVQIDDVSVRVITSPHCGLSAARNIGVRMASTEICAFVDDDAVPVPGYIKALQKVFEDPLIMGVAGRILINETMRPYAKTHVGPFETLLFSQWGKMLGGNMAFRKSALDQVGGFDERFGAGQQWSSGEETDMFFRMSHQKMKLVYAPQVVVYHPREDVGHTPQSLRTKLYAYGKGNGALFAKHIHTYHSLGLIASYLWSLVKPLLRIVQYFCMLQCNTALLHRAVLTGRVVGYWEYLRGHR